MFPLVSIKGCVFHWVQSVWRKVQELGLATAYRTNQAIHQYIRQLMALPFLPAGHITETFHQLQARANSVQLTQLVDYVNRQWINNAIFRVEDWSVFRRSIRTNNDVEGNCNIQLILFLFYYTIIFNLLLNSLNNTRKS